MSKYNIKVSFFAKPDGDNYSTHYSEPGDVFFDTERFDELTKIITNDSQNARLFFSKIIPIIFSESQSSYIDEDSCSPDNEQFNTYERIDELTRENEKLNKELEKYNKRKNKKEIDNLNDKITSLNKELSGVQYQLKNKTELCDKYQKDSVEYFEEKMNWKKYFSKFSSLEHLAKTISSLEQNNKNLQPYKQQYQETEQELKQTQQKLAVAIARIRGSIKSVYIAGGDSRTDLLKDQFTTLKLGLFADVSRKVLTSWQNIDAKFTFKTEEFSQIKSILSGLVFCAGMKYFAKDKSKIDAELDQIMAELTGIGDITPIALQSIQDIIHTGLLRFNGVDHSDEALTKYVEETTQLISQDLFKIANIPTTDDNLIAIREFVDEGLKLVRDIVNDPHSGEVFISDNDIIFDENEHEPSRMSDPKGKIKMTLYAGYRVAGNILVKSEVVTYEDEPVSIIESAASGPSRPAQSMNTQEEYDAKDIGKNIPLNKENENPNKLIDLVDQAAVSQHAVQTNEDGGDDNASQA